MFGLFRNCETKDKNEEVRKVVKDYSNPQPIADYFLKRTGICFDKQMTILKSKLSSFCTLRHINSFEECLSQIKSSAKLEQELIDYLTTNETFFYREFEQIRQLVADIVTQKKKVNILCAPCATGEEPYSIVIALLESGFPAHQFDIIGMDINITAIESAKKAVFNHRNVSKLPSEILPKYFKIIDGKYHLQQSVKSKVQFKMKNLFDSDIHSIGKFDYVLSRNMLIYFDMATKKQASSILTSLLKDSNQPVLYGHADLY